MSCISSNFSSFFLNSLNDPSEFSKYLSNGELRFSSTFEDFQVYGQSNVQQQQQQQQPHHINGGVGVLVNTNGELISSNGEEGNSNIENTQPIVTTVQHYGSYQQTQQHQQQMQQHHGPQQTRWVLPHQQNLPQNTNASSSLAGASAVSASTGAQHFDGSFEFMKYLRHSNDYNDNSHDASGQQNQSQSSHATAVGTKSEASLNNGLMDLDSTHKRATPRKTPVLSSANSNHHNPTASNSTHPTPMDIYDHDSKHNIYDLHHMNSVHSSNSNESSMELSSMTYPNSHLNASNSNTSSEGCNTQHHSDFSMLSGVANSLNSSTNNAASAGTAAAAAAAASPAAPKPLASFTIKDNFEAHPSHKVEEGIFQHMNKLPSKKKENLKQLGVRFTGQMTLNDKSIIVENFIKFCQEYEIKDHRPFLSLNQSGLNKPDQIKFARYLGQGLPTFTLFCIYSNFKNLFCTKRTEIYTKDGYNLPYILDKIKRFLANTTAGNNNNTASNSSFTSTTTKDSSSNTISTNSNTTPNTTAMNANNSNNNAATAVPPAMQNGSSNDNSNISNGNATGNDNGKGSGSGSSSSSSNRNSIFNNDIINTPNKQIHNVPSPITPRTPQIQQQQTPQMQIQTQNTPLAAHPPPATHAPTQILTNHTTTPQTHLHTHHHQQQLQLQQHHHHTHQHQQQQQQQQHHHVQMPMSPMVVVTTTSSANIAAPSTIMASPLPPTAVLPATASVTHSTSANHNQHPHHMQSNNHLPLHHHPHHHVHPVANAQPAIHHTAAVVYHQQQQQQHSHHHQQQLQNHHPLHNLAAQNPPL